MSDRPRQAPPTPSPSLAVAPRVAVVAAADRTTETAKSPGGEHVVPGELAGRPLDGIVRSLFGVTWGNARKWIESGKVQVDSQVVLDHGRAVRAGVKVVLTMSAPKRGRARRGDAPELDDSAIVFVDAHIVVVNKPAGVSTIPFDENEKGTLDESVRAWLSKRMKRGERGDRPSLGVVHRLDKETSGVLVFTRSWLAKQSLTQQFRVHTVHRRYLSIAHGVVQARTLRSTIFPDRGDGLRGSIRANARGKRSAQEGQLAITHLEPLQALDGATLVACKLETGRTHQIRVHLSESGHPVVGERVYIRGFLGPIIPAPRLMLHAAELGFVHPATNVEVRFERPPPADFDATLARLSLPLTPTVPDIARRSSRK